MTFPPFGFNVLAEIDFVFPLATGEFIKELSLVEHPLRRARVQWSSIALFVSIIEFDVILVACSS